MKSICDEKIFTSLHKSHQKEVRNFIYYKSGDYDLADDLAQESFVTIWENCKSVIFENAKGYLFTVANRLFLNKIRKDKVVLKFKKEITNIVNHQDPSFILEEKEFKSQLEAAISNLPEKQRVVFLMNRMDKMPYKDIASALDISVKAVEKRMGIALKNLKESISELKIRKI